MGNKLPEPAQLDTENKVMDLRRQGFSWRNIAEQTGFANHSGAMKAYRRAMERYQKEPREDLQRIEGERLDDIFNAFFAKAIADLDPQAAMIAIRTIESRAKLFGLNEPVKIQNEVTVTDGGDLDERVRQFAYLIAEARTAAIGYTDSEQISLGEHSKTDSTAADIISDLADSVGSGMGQDSNGSGVDSIPSPESEEDPLGGNSQDIG